MRSNSPGSGRHAAFRLMDALPLYEEMIVTGAWWDFVDEIAGNRLGPILRADPAAMKPAMLEWACCANMWKRRSAILCQLGAKEATDARLPLCLHRSFAVVEGVLSAQGDWMGAKAICAD